MPTLRRPALIAAASLFVAATVLAQTKGKPGRAAPKPKTTHAAPQKAAPAASAAPKSDLDTTPAATAAPMTGRAETKTSSAKDTGAADAGSVTVVDKDGGAKQFKFGETDIEGR